MKKYLLIFGLFAPMSIFAQTFHFTKSVFVTENQKDTVAFQYVVEIREKTVCINDLQLEPKAILVSDNREMYQIELPHETFQIIKFPDNWKLFWKNRTVFFIE